MKKVFVALFCTIYMYGASNLQIADLEAKLIENESDHKSRLDLARIYFELGMLEEARQHFEIVLASNPPQQVAENIALFLGRIEAMNKRSDLSLFVQVGYGQDDNLNANPGEDKLLDFMALEYNLERNSTQVSDAVSDSFTQATLGADYGYDFARKGFWSLMANGYIYSQNFSSESDYDIGFAQASAGPRYRFNGLDVSLPFSYSMMQYGGEDFMKISGLSPSVNYIFSKRLSFYLSSSQSQKKYDQEDYKARDSKLVSYMGGVHYILGNTFFGAGVSQESDSADSKESTFVDRSASDIRLSIGIKLPAYITLEGKYLQRLTAYDDTISSGENREDALSQVTLSGSMQMMKNLSVGVRYVDIKNSSDYVPAEYEKTITSLSVSYRY